MFFGRKKKSGMIDVGELQKRGRVLSPDIKVENVVTDNEGFVEMNGSDSSLGSGSLNSSVNGSKDGYSKREVDSKIQQLDSVIYKLEQRIELLEKKAGFDSGSSLNDGSSNSGLISW